MKRAYMVITPNGPLREPAAIQFCTCHCGHRHEREIQATFGRKLDAAKMGKRHNGWIMPVWVNDSVRLSCVTADA